MATKMCDNMCAMARYRNRVSGQILAFKLVSAGAVLVEGVKRCGKTTTCAILVDSIRHRFTH